MATHMGKPVKEILERGFESSSNANASQFEHEGCAETLGEPKRKSFAREAHNAREAAEAALLAAQADEKADEDRIHDSVETVDPHDLETVKFCGQEAVMREVFPWATRVTSFLRIPTQLTLTLIALVYIPVVIHTQIVFTVLCFWSINVAKFCMDWIRPLAGSSIGWDALFEHVQREVHEFHERTILLFPTTPRTSRNGEKTSDVAKTRLAAMIS